MPAKGYLSEELKEKLQKELKKQEHPEIRERVLILLLLNDGKTQKEIAEFIGCSIRKVAYWCVHGDAENLESLSDERMKGNAKKVSEEYTNLLIETVGKEPEEYGYEFGRWTAARLATHMEEQTGIKLSGKQVGRILVRKKFVYIWAKYSLEEKRDPEKRKECKARLANYKRIAKESPEKLQLWFWDESGFSLRVIRRKVWGRKGQRKKVNGQQRKGRVNVMGGARFNDKKRWVEFIGKGNSESFYEVLKIFYEEVKQEWVDRGENAEEFETKGPKLIIVLDNASFHKKEEVIKNLAAEMPNIVLDFLPPYSPDYNLIELVWHSAKEYIANRIFKSVEQLEQLLHKLLNEGELVIRWERKIKNKGDAVNAI